MTNWNPGDTARCVDDEWRGGPWPRPCPLRQGVDYTVSMVTLEEGIGVTGKFGVYPCLRFSDAVSVQPFASERQNNRREFVLYDTQGGVERIKHIDVDLSDFIQALEPLVCGRIGRGVRIPQYSAHIKVTPELIRSRCAWRPLPEARAWCWFFLIYHPDFRQFINRVGKLYGRDHSTLCYHLRELQFALRSNKALAKFMQEIADDLLIEGYAPFTVAHYARTI